IDVSPLQKCIDKLEEVAKRYQNQGRLAGLAQFRRDGDDIQRLRVSIEVVSPIMGLSVGMTIADQLEDVRQMARLQTGPKLVPVPKSTHVTNSFHVVHVGKVDRMLKTRRGDGGPAVAALTGWNEAGKTTSAAAMVGERGAIRPRA
ncbi:unnamed protein product, partial [Ectocarpus sp. 12 AP-2014]